MEKCDQKRVSNVNCFDTPADELSLIHIDAGLHEHHHSIIATGFHRVRHRTQ